MKTQLVKLPGYNVITSEEEIREGDIFLVPHNIEGETLSNKLIVSNARL